MLAQEFLHELSIRLKALAPQERDKALSYYSELISDKLENGEREEDIIAGFGSLYELAQNILAENNITSTPKKKSIHPAVIVALIIGSPLIFAAVITVASVVFSLLVAAASVIFSFLVAAIAIFVSGVVIFAVSFTLIATEPIVWLLQIGASFILLGVSIFLMIAAFYIGKGLSIGANYVFNKIKQQFRNR